MNSIVGGVISILGAPSLGPIKLKEKSGVLCFLASSLMGLAILREDFSAEFVRIIKKNNKKNSNLIGRRPSVLRFTEVILKVEVLRIIFFDAVYM